MSREEIAWRELTQRNRRNLYKIRATRMSDADRMSEIEYAYRTPKEKYRAAHEAELKAEKDDVTVYGIEEAEAVLAARTLPVPPRTGKEQEEEEEDEEDAELAMVVQQSLQPPVTGGGTHDVEAGTSGAVRWRAVARPRSPSPVASAAVTGSAPVRPVLSSVTPGYSGGTDFGEQEMDTGEQGPADQEVLAATSVPLATTGVAGSPVPRAVSPVPAPQPAAGNTIRFSEVWDLWQQAGVNIRALLRGRAGPGGLTEDPLITQFLDGYEERMRSRRGDGSGGQ